MEILIEMDKVSIIVIEKNSCCVCLEEFNIDTSDMKMKCCLNVIHKKCLFDILMYTQNLTLHCPLCRIEHNFKYDNILQLNEILDIYTEYKDTFNYKDHNIKLQNIIDKYTDGTTNVNGETTNNRICIRFKKFCIISIIITIIVLIFFSLSKK